MLKKKAIRVLSLILVTLMIVGVMPLSIFAAGSVTNYSDFLANFKMLEAYAYDFAASSNKDPGELVLNFVRTGVDRYQTGNWETLAGAEITAFTSYVEQQDAANGTTVMNLRDIVIDDFKLPNGNQVDFGHMFGTMNISYINTAVQSDDLSGWAGDICDLFFYSVYEGNVPDGSIEEVTAFILEYCFGKNAPDAFGWDDFYGDMDAYYLINEYSGSFASIMESYYTEDLDDTDRAAYFLNNRFAGVVTRDDVRTAIYNAYRTNVGIQVLEADRGLSDYSDMRKAACYAFADYLFTKAEGHLIGGGSGDDDEDETPENGYYSVFSSTSSILAPGISQKINYATSTDGKQMVYYVATVDVTRDDVTIMVNYNNNDPSKGWAMQRLEDQVAALVKNHSHIENFTPVVATNGDGFNTTTGKPGGLLVMEGVEWHPVDGDGFFAILADGSAMIGTKEDYEIYKGQIQEGIGLFGSGKYLVKDGQIVASDGGTRASRTAIGIKADGSVVMMVLDGRQEPFSCGGTMAEIATIMYEAGCVTAVNLDGGGSTTYMSKPEGSDNIKVVNRPSDGYARSIAASLVAVSTAKSSKEFDRAIISSDYDYLTIGSSVKIDAIGVNNIGSSADIPAGSYWTVSDESIGSIDENGIFTALTNGDVTVSFIVNGEVAGSKELYVVVPDKLEIEGGNVIAIFGKPTRIPVVATYEGKDVLINENDIFLGAVEENAGVFDGFMFTGDANVGIRNVNAAAVVLAVDDVGVMFNINLYHEDEAYFDFDNATSGNRTLAWVREVLNAKTEDGILYTIVDPSRDMTTEYTFALDMTAIEIPQQLADIVFMLPGSDNGNASAFNYLLQLAERVSVLTEVRITAQFDPNLIVDVSELKIVNDYFKLTSATVDENNKLTMICNWIDRTQPIAPETANPVCILTGIKVTPEADAKWVDEELVIINQGNVGFDIYLRASSLYSFANKPENQQKYGLYPYTTDKTGYEGGTESGAHFSDSYAEFQDHFILSKTSRQGWTKEDGEYYYYVDGMAQTGIQYIPSKEDAYVKKFYRFDETGVCEGTVTGTVSYNGALYYASGGKMQTGWISDYDDEGNVVYYYFNPSTGIAVDGEQVIDGYNYTFTNYVLTRGDLVTDSKGTRYRWAGKWLGSEGKYIWFEVDGKTYITGSYNPYVLTGFVGVPSKEDTSVWSRYLFGDDGSLRTEYVGLCDDGNQTYYVENGKVDYYAGLVNVDGYYYYVSWNVLKNQTKWLVESQTNGLVPAGLYSFDENGRMTNPPSTPDTPDTPDTPEILNGIVESDGKYYYYINGVRINSGGYELTDEDGKTFYIYVRSSNSTLATGKYWPTDSNGIFESRVYDFGTDGKYYPPEEEGGDGGEGETPDPDTPVNPEPEVKNGIVEENGKLYYYVNGVLYEGGMVKLVDENNRIYYIYVRTSTSTLATGNYWPTANEYLVPGMYNFGTDGKYYPPIVDEPDTPDEPDPDEKKEGIVEVNGKLYYYENGVISSKFGLIKLTDDEGKEFYIYVRSSNLQVVVGSYWITATNDLIPIGIYDFGTDGKYYPPVTEEPDTPDEPDTPTEPEEKKDGIVNENGKLYYYEDGKLSSKTGLIKLTDEEGKTYYIYVKSSNLQVVTGKYWPTATNGLLPAKMYDFGTDGRYYPAD